MKRKILTLLAVLLPVLSIFTLTACMNPIPYPNDATNGSNHVHDLVYHRAAPSSCIVEGNIEYWSCAICDKYFIDDNGIEQVSKILVSKTDHLYDINGTCIICRHDKDTEKLKYSLSLDRTYYSVTGNESPNGEIIIPAKYNDLPVRSIEKSAFRNCSSLTSVIIPDSVISIGDYAFRDCSNLTSVSIGSGVTSIGEHAFQNCSSLESVNIPHGVTSVKNSAFYNCSSLKSINIPDNVTSIEPFAFARCSSLTSIIMSNSVTIIGDSAFQYCASLESINIPENVTSIGSYTFEGCSSLESVTIPEKITSIPYFAFHSCKSLKNLTIPDSVRNIAYYAFSACTSLTDVYFTETEDEWNGITIGSGNTYLTNATIHYNYVPED